MKKGSSQMRKEEAQHQRNQGVKTNKKGIRRKWENNRRNMYWKLQRKKKKKEWRREEEKKLNSVAWVRERTIPTERPKFIGEVSVKFCG
jgi:hypothetical protein